MTFRNRLLLAQAPLAAALLLLGAASLRTVSHLGQSSEEILRENYRSALAAQNMAAALGSLEREALLRAAGRPPAEPSATIREQFESELRLQAENITEAGEAEATERLRTAWEAYQRVHAAAASTPDPVAAYLGPVQEASIAVRAAADQILSLNQSAMVRKSVRARRTSRDLLMAMAVAILGALALGVVASTAVTARTVRPLSALAQAVRRFGEGDLESRARPRGEDEIAALGREFDVMADRLERYRRSSIGDLLVAQQTAQAAIDSLPDPVLVLDPSGLVLNLNGAAESLLRQRPDEGIGKAISALDPALSARLDPIRARALLGKGSLEPQGLDEAIRVDRPDGPRRLLPRASAVRSPEEVVVGVTIVLQDVTRLARFDELKDDLVATVAHEFRTPLTSLQMAIHMCAEEAAGPLTEEQADLMWAARQDCERLQVIVDDILDLSRIQSGQMEIDARALDAQRLLARAVSAVEARARGAGIELTIDSPGEPVSVLADPERIEIVLANLLGNAVRHTPPKGAVVVRARGAGASARFEVQDSGTGIPAQFQDRVFQRFFRVPGAKRGGVGLGLFISREIVRAHGGEIGMESEPGHGSTFWFTLPTAAPRPEA